MTYNDANVEVLKNSLYTYGPYHGLPASRLAIAAEVTILIDIHGKIS